MVGFEPLVSEENEFTVRAATSYWLHSLIVRPLGLEPRTPSLKGKYSTTELRARTLFNPFGIVARVGIEPTLR